MGLGYVLYRLIGFYEMLIFVMCIMSWIPMREGILRDFYEAIRSIVEPYLNIFRRLIPSMGGMPIDLSPIIAVFVLEMIGRLVISL